MCTEKQPCAQAASFYTLCLGYLINLNGTDGLYVSAGHLGKGGWPLTESLKSSAKWLLRSEGGLGLSHQHYLFTDCFLRLQPWFKRVNEWCASTGAVWSHASTAETWTVLGTQCRAVWKLTPRLGRPRPLSAIGFARSAHYPPKLILTHFKCVEKVRRWSNDHPVPSSGLTIWHLTFCIFPKCLKAAWRHCIFLPINTSVSGLLKARTFLYNTHNYHAQKLILM